MAERIIAACSSAGIAVPGQAAVVGVDDEEQLCENADVSISRVRPDYVHAGSDAVEVAVKTAAGRWKKRFPDGTRDATVTTYQIAIPLDEARISFRDLTEGFVFGVRHGLSVPARCGSGRERRRGGAARQ